MFTEMAPEEKVSSLEQMLQEVDDKEDDEKEMFCQIIFKLIEREKSLEGRIIFSVISIVKFVFVFRNNCQCGGVV